MVNIFTGGLLRFQTAGRFYLYFAGSTVGGIRYDGSGSRSMVLGNIPKVGTV